MKHKIKDAETACSRLIISIILLFARTSSPVFSVFRALSRRIFRNRRVGVQYHMISERRRTPLEKLESLLGIEVPSAGKTWRVQIVALVATLQVLVITLATAEIQPANLLLISTYCFYAIGILKYRQYRIESLAS